MPFIGDEDIIALRVAAENVKRHSVLNKVTIGGITYQFEEREVCPYFYMVLPKTFDDLSPEYVLLKYPNVNRPKIILSNEEGTVNFAFEHMSDSTEEMEARLTTYKAVIKKLHPSYAFFSECIYDLESGLKAAYYDFRGIAIDDDIYCLNFFTDLPTGELFGWFTCPIDLKDKWGPLARQMIQTIKPSSQN